MKSTAIFLCCLWLLVVGATAQTKEESAVIATCATFNKAIIDGDKGQLENLTLPALSYGHSSGLVENQSQFINVLASGSVDFTSIDITDQTVQISGKNAIVRNNFKGSLIKEGKPTEIKIGVLMVWQNINGHWKLLARQGYKL